jgi:hypothetical protein
MINRPPAATTGMVRHASLPLDQQPAPRAIRVDLGAGQQLNIVSQQLLDLSLGTIRRADSLSQRAVRTHHVHKIRHRTDATPNRFRD